MEAERSLRLIAYLEGDLDQQERLKLQYELRKDPELQVELDKLGELYAMMESEADVEVPEMVRDDFNALLASEKQRISNRKLWLSWGGKAAAAIALIAIGVWLGKSVGSGENQQERQLAELRNEIRANRELILQSLEKPSATQRIMAVTASAKINSNSPDAEVIDALVKVMNTDDNTNVRLAAVRALSRFADKEHIRKALTDAVLTQSDPLVQVFLIDILVDLKEDRIVPSLRELIESDTIMEAVRDEARWGIIKLS